MVRSNRAKDYSFSIGSLTSNADGRISAYTNDVINGTIQKIIFRAGNYTATGSLFVWESGVPLEQVWNRNGSADTDAAVYPFVYPVNTTNTTGSPQAFVPRVVNAPLLIGGSGLGNGTSGLGLRIVYI